MPANICSEVSRDLATVSGLACSTLKSLYNFQHVWNKQGYVHVINQYSKENIVIENCTSLKGQQFLQTLAAYQNLPSFDASKQKSSPSPKVWRFKNISDTRLNRRGTEAKRLNCTVDESFNDWWQICFALFHWTGSIFIWLNICLFAWDKLVNDSVSFQYWLLGDSGSFQPEDLFMHP
jgi:hypothetical protein